ncbi:MAG: glycogen synthase GlgA [Negativicutes bacterium]|nr:glycogen synthase GlgA [Negativicutes bacterium]
MKSVLFVAAEAVPFAKTGGMGDVVGSLPKELKKQGLDVRVIMPKYEDIPIHLQEKMVCLKNVTVPLGWRLQYGGLLEAEYEGLTYYFVDNEYYFKRRGLYGHYDDGERFAFFCRAVLELLPYLDFKPEILHCHDWHTAALPVLLDGHYRHIPEYAALKTVLTIHNIEYQGVFDKAMLVDLLGLDAAVYFTDDKLKFQDSINFLQGGIVFADAVTTVSPTYANEILTPEGGERLEGVLRQRQDKLTGILNGIDYDVFNPTCDSLIYQQFTRRSISRKQTNKTKLQEFLCLPVNPEVPLIGIVSRLVAAKGLDLFAAVLEDLTALDLQIVILGTGEEKYESMFRVAAHQHPDKMSVNLYFDESLAHRIYAGADINLMPSRAEPCGISQLIALRYGTIPVVRETGGLKDTITAYNEYTGEGNGFSFAQYNAHDMLYTLNRAIGFYHDKEVWPKLVKAAMASDFSWQRSASDYSALYERLD